MERQSTSKLFRILIAIAAFFILCSSSLLFAACDSTIGVKDHEHVLGETAIAETEASCTVPGTVTYKCTDEECSYVKTVVTGLPTGHDFDENGVCRVCKLTKSEAGDLDDTLQSTQAIQETLAGITKKLEDIATGTDLQTKLATDTFNSTLESKLTDLQTKLIADLLSAADFGTAMSTLKTTLQCDIVAQVYLPLLAKCPTEFAALKTELVGKELVKAEADDLTVLKAAITSDEATVATKLNAVLTAAMEADGKALDAAFDALNECLPNTLKTSVVDVLEAYLSGNDFLGKIMGETGFKGLQQQIEGYLGEGSDVVTQLDNIWEYLDKTLKGQINGIVEKLGDEQSGLVKSVKDLATQLTTATSDIKDAIGKLQIPTAADIADAVNTKLEGSLKTYFASSEYTKIIQGLLDNTFTTEKLNTLLGVTGESLVKELNAKFEGVTGAIGELKTLLTEGTTGQQIAALEDMIKQVYSRLYGSEYKPSVQGMMDSLLGAPSTGLEEKPDGMLDQVADLWDKTKGLLDGLAAMQGENDGATLSAILAAVQGIEIPEGKDYTENFTNLTNTLNTLNTNYGTINTTLEKLQGDYDNLKTSYETLVKDVSSMQTTLGEVQTKLNGLVQDLQWVLTRSAKFEALMTVLENLWTEYGSYVLNEDLRSGLKTVLDFAVKNVDKLDRLNDIADTLAWFVNNKSTFESYVDNLGTYIEDFNKIYDAFHKALPDESLDTVLGKLVTFFQKALDNNYFEEAINAAKGLKNFLGTTDESGTPTITLKDIDEFFDGISETLDGIKNKGYDKNGNHVHSWVEVLATNKDGAWVEAEAGVKPSCVEENTYIYKCTICDLAQTKTDGTPVIKKVSATGHVVEYKTGLTADGHHHEPTCVNPGYVQGHCVNCDGDDGQGYLAGDWSTYGEPTYKHHYVLESGLTDKGTQEGAGFAAHECDSVHEYVYHCETCGSAYVEKVASDEFLNPSDPLHGITTPHNYYSSLDENGNLTGKPITEEEKLKAYKAYAEANGIEATWETAADAEKELTPTQQYDALEKHLNIVKRGAKTCVDPALFVVECTVCKMRYAYSYGEPSGHTLTLMVDDLHTRTCTTDGLRVYYYCDKCEHYFDFGGKIELVTESSKDTYRQPNSDIYRYSVEYLKDTQGIITGKPTDAFVAGTTPALTVERTEAGQRAYDMQAEKAYGHKFTANTYTIDGDCLNPWRIFDVCEICGLKKEDLEGHTYKNATITADPNNTAKVTDVDTGDFTANWGEPATYPDYIKNLQDVWDGGTLTRKIDKDQTKTYTGVEGVKELLTELGYFTYCDVDLKGIKGVIGDANTLLSEKIITGWNISYIFADYEAAGHDFVPVKTNTLAGAGLCITAQDYVLVCKNCFKTSDGKTFGELFEDADKDGLYEAKSDNSTCNTAEAIKAAATKDAETALVTKQWKMFWTEDGKLATNQKHWRGGTFVTADVTVEDVARWLNKHGYLTRAAGDDETQMGLLEDLLKLDGAQEATLTTLKSYYGTNGADASNVIGDFELPVVGHTFDKFVALNEERCVTGMHYAVVCSVCGEEISAESALSSHKISDGTTDTEAASTTKGDNDLDTAWKALTTSETVTAEEVVEWLQKFGYLNRYTAGTDMQVGATLAAKGVFVVGDKSYTLRADDETTETLVTTLSALDWSDADDKAYIESFYSKSNYIETYGTEPETTLQLPVKGHNFNEFVYTVVGNCVMYARKVYFCTDCGNATVTPSLWEDGAYKQPDHDTAFTFGGDDDSYIATGHSGQGTNELQAAWDAVYDEGNGDAQDIILWLLNYGYLNAERDLLGFDLTKTITLTDGYKTFIGHMGWGNFTTGVLNDNITAEFLADYFTAKNVTKEFIVNQVNVGSLTETGYPVPRLVDIELGHKFTAVKVESASCEDDGYYVYVCTECGEVGKLGNLSYTIGDKTFTTTIKETGEFTEAADDTLFKAAVPDTRESEINGGKTDLELEWTAVKEKDTAEVVGWLFKKGYLNTVRDTLNGVGTETYDEAKLPYKELGALLKALTEKVEELIKGDIKIEDFFTGKNKTFEKVGTTVPVMNHLMKDGKGNAITDETALCTDFKDTQLTEWFNEGYYAVWEDGKWTKSEEKFDESMFDDHHPLNKAWYENAKKYGIIGACSRENCPQHTTKYTGKVQDGEFTAGYVAATEHEMHYYKRNTVAGGLFEYGVPAATFGNDEPQQYNMDAEKDYPKTVEINGEEVTYTTRDDDPTNLYTLQRIYNALHHLPENEDNRYPEDGSLWAEYGKDGAKEVKWQPLTRNDAPSCWIDLHCKWYHYGSKENPLPEGSALASLYKGDKCNEKGADNSHTPAIDERDLADQPEGTLPDSDAAIYKANCQHGGYCRVCGAVISNRGAHYLLNVEQIIGKDEEGNFINQMIHDEYGAAYDDLVAKLKADFKTKNGRDAKVEDIWAIPLEATCTQKGREVWICTGELGLYQNEHKPQGWDELFSKADGWTIASAADATDGNYFTKTIEKIEHEYNETVWYVIHMDEHGYTKDPEAYTTEEEFKQHYNSCLDDYYMVDYCTNHTRNEEGVVDETLVCKQARVELKPTKEEYNADWTKFFTADQIAALKNTKPSWASFNASPVNPRYGDPTCASGSIYNGYGSTKGWTDKDGHYSFNVVDEKYVAGTYKATGHYLAPMENYWEKTAYYKAPQNGHNAQAVFYCYICGQQFTTYYKEGEFNWAYTVNGFDMTDEKMSAWNDANPDKRVQKMRGQDDASLPQADELKDLWLDGSDTNAGWLTGGSIVLGQDLDVDQAESGSKYLIYLNDTDIDLGGHTLEFKDPVKGVSSGFWDGEQWWNSGKKITFRNGTLKLGSLEQLAAVNMGTVELESVTVEFAAGKGQTIMPGANGKIIIKNSVIKGDDYAPIFTNGSQGDGGSFNSTIILEDSVIIGKTIGLLFNNASANLTAKRCTFYGSQIGAVVRGGTATFQDCTFYCGETAASGSDPWGSGMQINAHAALVLGNNGGDYGDATVTLTGCTFGSATLGDDGMPVGQSEMTDDAEKLAVYALANHETTVTLDKTTATSCLGSLVQHGEEEHIHLLYDFQNDTVSSAEAAALILGAATSGGAVNLPAVEGGITLGSKEEPETLDIKKDLELVLAPTAVLNVTGGITIEDGATLVIEGGTVNAGTPEGANTAVAVKAGSSLTLNATKVTVDGYKPNTSTYGIYGEANTKISVANGYVYNPYGPAVGTNAHQGPVTLVLTDSAFYSGYNKEATDSTSVGVLLNNKDSQLFAGGCLFYGDHAAAWVRGGKAMFAGCSFVSAGEERANEEWYSGAGFKGEAQAAVVIGNGNDTVYGSTFVEIIDCEVSFKKIDSEENAVKPEDLPATTSFVELPEADSSYEKNAWLNDLGTETEGTVTQKMMVVAVDYTLTEVLFSDIDTAKAFLGEDLDYKSNVRFYGTASDLNVNLGYYKEDAPDDEDEEPDLVYIAYPWAEEIATFLTTTKNGQTLTIPTDPDEWYDIPADWTMKPEYEEGLAKFDRSGNIYMGDVVLTTNPAAGHTLTLDLGYRNLIFQGSVETGGCRIVVGKASLQIKNGYIEGASVETNANTALTLENVTLYNPDGDGVVVNSTRRSGDDVKIKNCQITGTTALLVSDRVDTEEGPSIKAEHSNFFGTKGYGAVITENVDESSTFDTCWFFGASAGALVLSGKMTMKDCIFTTNAWGKAGEHFSWAAPHAIPKTDMGALTIVSFVNGPELTTAKRPAPYVTIEGTAVFAELKPIADTYPANDVWYFVGSGSLHFSDPLTGMQMDYDNVDVRSKADVSLVVVLNGETAAESAKISFTCPENVGSALNLKKGTNVHVYDATRDEEQVGRWYTVAEKGDASTTDYFEVTGTSISEA